MYIGNSYSVYPSITLNKLITNIAKEKLVIEAEATAEKTRRIAKGEADAIFLKMKAEADGINAILTKQADGFSEIVKAANGNPNSAISLMIADKLEGIVASQVEAIKGIKIDKVTVWDNLGNGTDGTPSTAKFLSGMLKSLPPLDDVFSMAGMDLPAVFQGKDKTNLLPKKIEVKEPKPKKLDKK